MNFYTHTLHSDERGISLLIVLLVGTIMLFTSLAIGQYALRMVTAMRARSEATQNLYTAEQAFECVKYWLSKDYRYFTNMDGTLIPECNETSFDFVNGIDSAADTINPTYDATTGLAEFRIPYDVAEPTRGGVLVEVERTDPSAMLFDGYVRTYSQSDTESSKKTSERFEEYHYRVLYGADIMFVVDRSGSIEDGDNRDDRSLANEWNEMLNAVNDSITLLHNNIPAPRIGIVSFGSDAYDTGKLAADCLAPGCNWREPDQKLTENINELIIDRLATPGNPDDDYPNMNIAKASTNLSLGISIAGAELMGKYYPHTGLDNPPLATFGVGKYSGEFERIVANEVVGGFSDLPIQTSPNDRTPDEQFPDIMVVITDGAPNGIMTHRRLGNLFHSVITDVSSPDPLKFIAPAAYTYEIGEAKLFRVSTGGAGEMVIDELSDVVGAGAVDGCHEYQQCNDNMLALPGWIIHKPSDVFAGTPPLNVNIYPHIAMCNGTLIANKLKDEEDIIIVAIYIGTDDTSEEATWLREYFVSTTAEGDPLFAMVTEYGDVQDALMYLFEQLDFIQAR